MSRARKAKASSHARSAMSCIGKVRDFSMARGLLEPGSRVLAGVSGGPDSMALMAMLAELSREMRFELAVAHFDHGIRKETKRERALVERFARRLDLPCFLGAGDVPAEARRTKKGLEETGRALRLEFLEEAARSWNAASIALGHTRDDQVETILHHIIRGSGWRGLRGIPARRGMFVHPLLECSRAEIRDYLRRARIRYAIDRTNLDTTLLRNRIRRKLIPYLEKNFTPAIGEALLRLSANLSEGWESLEAPLRALVPPARGRGEVRAPLEKMARLSDFQIYLWIDLLLRERFDVVQDVEKKHFDAVKRLVRSGRSGRRIELPHGVEARVEHSSFVLRRNLPEEPRREIIITGMGTYPLPGWNLIATVEAVSAREIRLLAGAREACFAAIRFPVRARMRKPGDRMVPFGMKGRRKLSDLFIDRKVPLSRRAAVPVFEDARGIFWVPGVAADERTRIAPDARTAVRIRLSETAGGV